MQRFSGSLTAILVLITFLFVSAPQAQAINDCTPATLRGPWGLVQFGNIAPVGPFATGGTSQALAGPFGGVGAFTADGSGNIVSGLAINSVNGVSVRTNFIGTYTITPDCVGTITLTFSAPPPTATPQTPANPFNSGQPSNFRFVTPFGPSGAPGTPGGQTPPGGGQTTPGGGQTTPGGQQTTPGQPGQQPAPSITFGQAVINFVLVGDGSEFLYSLAEAGTAITGRGVRQAVQDRF